MSKPRRPRHARPVSKPVPAGSGETASILDGAAIPAAEPAPAAEATEDHAETGIVAFDGPGDDAAAAALESVSSEEAAAETATEPASTVVEAAAPAAPGIASAQIKAESFGITVMNYVIGEGEAFAAHMRALAGARSMADFVRLQIGEFQRAADATLTCWGMLAFSASRPVSAR